MRCSFYVVFSAAILLPRRLAVAAMTLAFLLLVTLGRSFALPQPFAFWCEPIILEFCLGMVIALCLRAGVRLAPVSAYGLGVAAVVALAASVPWEPTGSISRLMQWVCRVLRLLPHARCLALRRRKARWRGHSIPR